MKSSSQVKRAVVEEYNRDPTGWHVFTTRDIRGHVDTVFVHGTDVWIVKEERVNPFETVGVGLWEKAEEPVEGGSLPSFGYRPLTEETFGEILRAVEDRGSLGEVIGSVLRKRPAPLDAVRGRRAIEGPLVHSPKQLNVLPRQRELDLKLRVELDRLLLRKYPHLVTTYT